MMSPNTTLYVYEIEGEVRGSSGVPPVSFVGPWNEDNSSYLFFTEPEEEYVDKCLNESNCVLKSRHRTIYKEWQDGFPLDGLEIRGIRLVPDDHPSPPSGALLFDPSVVFGDGSHPTTLACVDFIADLVAAGEVRSMLDLGTGSGILSIAAAYLGVNRIAAIDRNVLAVQTAQKNVERNGLTSKIAVMEGDARLFFDSSHDLAVANLPFEVLQDIAELDQTADVRLWVLSGVSEAQGAALEQQFVRKGFHRICFRSDHPWVTLVMERTA